MAFQESEKSNDDFPLPQASPRKPTPAIFILGAGLIVLIALLVFAY